MAARKSPQPGVMSFHRLNLRGMVFYTLARLLDWQGVVVEDLLPPTEVFLQVEVDRISGRELCRPIIQPMLEIPTVNEEVAHNQTPGVDGHAPKFACHAKVHCNRVKHVI